MSGFYHISEWIKGPWVSLHAVSVRQVKGGLANVNSFNLTGYKMVVRYFQIRPIGNEKTLRAGMLVSRLPMV